MGLSNVSLLKYQARKQEEDVAGICDMCDKLRVSQVRLEIKTMVT